MADYVKAQLKELADRISEPRHFIQVIAGPRQVGKSTLVNQFTQGAEIPYSKENADAISPDDSDWIRRVWDAARGRMRILGAKEYLLVIDEIQKIANWSEYVKREWDADTSNRLNLKVILLGSSRLLLRKGLTESLAGRYEMLRMGHWTYAEMRDAFGLGLEQYIYFGGYPGAAHLIANESRWRKYVKEALVAPAIEKDVIMTSNIYKPALMHQLFSLGCSYSGELLSLTKIVGQLADAGNTTTVANYIELLDQSNLLTGLMKYAEDDARKHNSVPKFQVYNNALLTAFKGKNFDSVRTDPTEWGRRVESAVGAYMMNIAVEEDLKLYYWRDRADEVDFVLSDGLTSVALEIKSGRRGMNKGLSVFGDKFPNARRQIVGTGGIPIEEFLQCDVTQLL